MNEALLKYFGPRKEELTLAGGQYYVCTLPDSAAVFEPGADTLWQFVTRCTFDAEGKPAFTDDDIPVLKATPYVLIAPLLRAIERVNAFDAVAEVKNSEAVPGSG